MDKNTLSNYGWIVIAVLVLSVMIALATPFGGYIKSGVENTTQGLFDTSEKAMNVVGMSAGDGSFENGKGDAQEKSALNPNGVIPTGASYYVNLTGETLQAGKTMPTAPARGDRFYYGDFVYGFGCLYTGSWDDQPGCDYWFVAVADFNKQTVSGEIMESIGGAPVNTMQNCFMNWNGVDASGVVIPSSITNMSEAFMCAAGMKYAPVIPSSVTDMSGTFLSCMSLESVTINATPTSFDNCFAYTAIDDISDILGDCQNKNDIFETVNATPWG